MYSPLIKNTNLFQHTTLVRQYSNARYEFSENVLETAVFVIGLLSFTFAMFENREKPFSEWLPSVKSITFLCIMMLLSSKLFLLLSEEIDPVWSTRGALFYFCSTTVYKVANFLFYTDNLFLVNKGESDAAEIIRVILKGIITLVILCKDSIELSSSQGYLPEQYEDYVGPVRAASWVVTCVYLIVIMSFFCMVCCSPSIK